ncbi:MAG: hypothetical protein QGF12_06045 [SAR202 cluster bacterium]|jgi:hypothetical protein|nr:hypothetical protein [SAR202 cluster bacterium]
MKLSETLSLLPSWDITTIAGVGYQENVPAKDADAGWPLGIVRRPDGDLIVADYKGHRIWRIDEDGILHTLAGDGVPGDSGDGGLALNARLNGPHDLAIDRHGNIYFSDLLNQAYRRIDYSDGTITRVAGSGQIGRGGDGGFATDAELDTTSGIAVDCDGNIFISSEWANTIRRIDVRTGVIETFAGLNARHYPSESGINRPSLQGIQGTTFGWEPGLSLKGYHGDGGPASAASFYHPEHLAFDSVGDLYVCDNSNNRVRKIEMETGIITTILGNGQPASNGDGGSAMEASTNMPDAICIDIHDNLYVSEKHGFRVRKVDAVTGTVTTLVGTGMPGYGEEGLPGTETACNSCESGLWADPDGTVFWSDCSGRVRCYDGETRIVTTVLGGIGVGDGDFASEAYLSGPGGISIGPGGDVFFADIWNQRIRVIREATRLIDTVAGNGARANGGDDGPALEASLGSPHDVSVDSEGGIVVTDTRHGRLRRVDCNGVIRSVAGTVFQWDGGEDAPAIATSLFHVQAVTHDVNGNVFVGDAIGRIRRIDAETGVMTTVAGVGIQGYDGDGGPATEARIGSPTAIVFDDKGSLYFTDSAYHVVRHIDTQGIITTLVGTGEPGCSQEGTPATEALINQPRGVAVGVDGFVYISDSLNNRVCRIGENGLLITVVGSGEGGYSGDGGPAIHSRLNEPHGLCFYGNDILLISDHYNNRIRAVRLG